MANFELGKEDKAVFNEWKKMIEDSKVKLTISKKQLKTALKCDYDRKAIANALRNTILQSATIKPVADIFKEENIVGEDGWSNKLLMKEPGWEPEHRPVKKIINVFERIKRFFKGVTSWLS